MTEGRMQKLNEELKSGQFKQVYLLYGEEGYLRRQYRDKLKEARRFYELSLF